jgi:hypothetical protein
MHRRCEAGSQGTGFSRFSFRAATPSLPWARLISRSGCAQRGEQRPAGIAADPSWPGPPSGDWSATFAWRAREPAQPSVFVDQAEQMRQPERRLGDDTMPLDLRVAGALILLFATLGEPVSAGAFGRRLKKHGVTVRGVRDTAMIGQHRRSVPRRCWPTCSA